MVSATKDLSALGSILELDCQFVNGFGGSFRYISGTGTIVLEATHGVGPNASWFAIIDLAGDPVGNLTTAGTTFFNIMGYAKIRARNTVAGASNLVSMGVS